MINFNVFVKYFKWLLIKCNLTKYSGSYSYFFNLIIYAFRTLSLFENCQFSLHLLIDSDLKLNFQVSKRYPLSFNIT